MVKYRNCKVGEVTETTLGEHGSGYGFGITSEQGRSLCFFAFEMREDAKQARADLTNVVAKTTEITPGNGGSPTR
jgi:hypothetical protein